VATIHISKVNLAIESRPSPGPVISKTNLAIDSRPSSAWAVISKVNLAIQSVLPLTPSSRGFTSIIWR
jgi:hypothetical protein